MADEGKEEEKSVVAEAKERYDLANAAYRDSRLLAIEDTRFALGDSDNGWQWPDLIRRNRVADQKVCLTVNMTAQHCNQIINNMRQNRPQCRVLPVDSGSDKKTAEILAGLIRNIQTSSNADDAHDVAAEHCIYGGEGYWRVVTEYESESSFNQVIKIKSITNPFLVYIDPAAKEMDKSDAGWGFIFEDISKEQAKREHPDIDSTSWIEEPKGWVTEEMIRRAEYFYCVYVADTAILLQDGTNGFKSDLEKADYDHLKQTGVIAQERKTQRKQWKWCKLLGNEDKPVDEKDWAGSYLPIISVIGKEVNVDGEIVRKGVVRDLKDPARMVNFSYSEAVQTVALQNKVPYIAAVEAMEGYENIWQQANTTNLASLPWNAWTDEGKPIPKPERQMPAVMPAAQVQMLEISTEQMRAASGQQNANFGIKSEASSGVGIQRLKAQGEIATFHFPDNQVRGLRYEAKVLIDLIPKVMDVRQVVRIINPDGREEKVTLDPSQDSAYTEEYSNEDIQKIFNPGVGKYDVVIDTGPSFQTQRQESFGLMSELAKSDQGFLQNYGDIFFRASDVPFSDQLAKRAEKLLPPALQEGKGKPLPPEAQQQIAQLTQHAQQLEHALQNAAEQNEQLESKQAVEMKKINNASEVDKFKAVTDRLKIITPYLTPQAIQEIANSTTADVEEIDLTDESLAMPPQPMVGLPPPAPQPVGQEQQEPIMPEPAQEQ